MKLPQTLSELEESGYQPKTVKSELRANLIEKMEKGEQLFPGIIGYDDTVIPEIENAILSCHDIILLGERGQAKTRIMRSLTALLDESLPVISGCEINDDPLHPLCTHPRHTNSPPPEKYGNRDHPNNKIWFKIGRAHV